MKTRCINLKQSEVLGLLDGSITALWRPVKDQSMGIIVTSRGFKPLVLANRNNKVAEIHCPYGQPGDVLIGREAFRQLYAGGVTLGGRPAYRADIGRDGNADKVQNSPGMSWRSAAQMPAALSRIRRELVSVECIQAIKAKAPEVVAMFGGALPKDRPVRLEQWFWQLKLKEAE